MFRRRDWMLDSRERAYKMALRPSGFTGRTVSLSPCKGRLEYDFLRSFAHVWDVNFQVTFNFFLSFFLC